MPQARFSDDATGRGACSRRMGNDARGVNRRTLWHCHRTAESQNHAPRPPAVDLVLSQIREPAVLCYPALLAKMLTMQHPACVGDALAVHKHFDSQFPIMSVLQGE